MTAVPAAIDGLLALLRTSTALAGVRIEDGPWLDRPTEPDVIVVGWLPDEGATVEWSSEPASLTTDGQSFDIQGLVSAWSGDTVMKTVRDRVDELLEAARAALRVDQTLGGAVSRARLVTLNLSQYQTSKGCEAAIEFAVHLNVF